MYRFTYLALHCSLTVLISSNKLTKMLRIDKIYAINTYHFFINKPTK